MPSYKAPLEDVLFLINDVFSLDHYSHLDAFTDITPDLASAVLTEAARLAEEGFAPLNAVGDRQGCRRDPDGSVRTPEGFAEAYGAFVKGGWVGLATPPDYGGQGLPYTFAAIVNEFASSANMALAMYPGLTQGAIAALLQHGTAEQKALYLPPMVAGTWTGTMNLTEPQCGTDLGLIRTRAERKGDGTYAITGTKIFISAGEHDLASNIVHLVLARVEGAPAGTKGLSLFIVPKFMAANGGVKGARNRVSCGSIEEKMGIHGNATCVMNYDGATGWLLGEENRGLNAMFTMMNEARLGVGIQGLALSEVAYQNAATYARDRLQGRALTGAAFPAQPADPIIVHPDVRRTLLSIKAFNAAARALVVWTSLNADVARQATDDGERQAAEDHLGLLTPVIKGVLTDVGFDNTVKAQQMFGGHGYIVETGVEQFVRDARIAMLYEGANGIQAIDLVGRKLPRDAGRAMLAFFAEVSGFLKDHAEHDGVKPHVAGMKTALDHLQEASMWFMRNALGKPDNAGAGSTDYMHLFGLVALGYMSLRIAKAAADKRAAATATNDEGAVALIETRLATTRFFMERMLPETALRLSRVTAGAEGVMSLPAEMF
ncbi:MULTISPECIES: acyl-CoA dehydrogenase C-terminal domain-containing protein [unclassified Chelatococcus]|uniref:acyl-CoA dehydrogenase C-terminal domain-containing protein n=1 Tax=unclassified Chelatococcus TaxID=2638111 RepID=UPI001BCDD02C|nr:acyl-CoA dehydrogenase C-terminal domain-containing protein [Chelatococcus sp.]MBS7696724.1 acyl-CoA dehydrogenase C-terminal domain-containing protein [Chelatococcus sp. YT9]MBX3555289.1 acyl-CoA dehydrogenase C-terminal domain-containing protein [Chelatococcus sp.]